MTSVAPAEPGGRITRSDVEAALSAQPASAAGAVQAGSEPVAPVPSPAAAATGRRVALSALRRTIARRMQASHQTTAPVTLTCTVDATELKRLRERVRRAVDPRAARPTYTDFLVKIVAHCLLRHPQLNAAPDRRGRGRVV